jgi:hypothetical protein
MYHLSRDTDGGGSNDDDAATANLVALALAYHDIALWTDRALDYLEPSAAVMEREVRAWRREKIELDRNANLSPAPIVLVLSDAEIDLVRDMIVQHHKVTDHRTTGAAASSASSEAAADAEWRDKLINAVRKADWADATYGLVRFGIPKAHLLDAYATVPEGGFHGILAGMGNRLSPQSVWGQLDVLKILKW